MPRSSTRTGWCNSTQSAPTSEGATRGDVARKVGERSAHVCLESSVAWVGDRLGRPQCSHRAAAVGRYVDRTWRLLPETTEFAQGLGGVERGARRRRRAPSHHLNAGLLPAQFRARGVLPSAPARAEARDLSRAEVPLPVAPPATRGGPGPGLTDRGKPTSRHASVPGADGSRAACVRRSRPPRFPARLSPEWALDRRVPAGRGCRRGTSLARRPAWRLR